MPDSFLGRELGEVHDREPVSNASQMSGSAIEKNFCSAWFSVNDVRFKPVAVGHIPHKDFFVRQQADTFSEISRNGEATLVVQARTSDGRTVDFRFQKRQVHSQKT